MEERDEYEQRIRQYAGTTEPTTKTSPSRSLQELGRDEDDKRREPPRIDPGVDPSRISVDSYGVIRQAPNVNETYQQSKVNQIFKDLMRTQSDDREGDGGGQAFDASEQDRQLEIEGELLTPSRPQVPEAESREGQDLLQYSEEMAGEGAVGVTSQHPLSVYFAQEATIQENRRAIGAGDQQITDHSPTSFGRMQNYMAQDAQEEQRRVMSASDPDYASANLAFKRQDPRMNTTMSPPQNDAQKFTDSDQINAMADHDNDSSQLLKISGQNSLFGSIEQSPKNIQKVSQSHLSSIDTQHRSNRSKSFKHLDQQHPQLQASYGDSNNQRQGAGQYNQDLVEVADATSSSLQFINPADNYQFLEGIREVDDDIETVGGAKSGQKSSSGPGVASLKDYYYNESIKDSINNSQGKKAGGADKLQEPQFLYGQFAGESKNNWTMQNAQQQFLWSSGMSRHSRESNDEQLSFGNTQQPGESPQPMQPPQQHVDSSSY